MTKLTHKPEGTHKPKGTRKLRALAARLTASFSMAAMIAPAKAADSVNVAFFLEWATPNQIAKVDKVYDEAMGGDVNWTDFSTGVQMTEAMLAGTTGIGFIENVARTVSDYELIWVTILIMGLLGLLFDLAMRWVIGRLIPWRGKG